MSSSHSIDSARLTILVAGSSKIEINNATRALVRLFPAKYVIKSGVNDTTKPIYVLRPVDAAEKVCAIQGCLNVLSVFIEAFEDPSPNISEKMGFDIIHKTTRGDKDSSARQLDRTLSVCLTYRDLFPRAPEIDSLNLSGYNSVAEEFDDLHRITTRNFHTLSRAFFEIVIRDFVTAGCDCLELGPGNGWLRTSFSWPSLNYRFVDLSPEMNGGGRGLGYRASARNLPFASNSIDIVIASLADPFLFPAAICEASRVLKLKGKFICSFPSSVWARALRSPESPHVTSFLLQSGLEARVYSFATDERVLSEIFVAAGMLPIREATVNGEAIPEREPISNALVRAAERLDIQLTHLPIVEGRVFEKCHNF